VFRHGKSELYIQRVSPRKERVIYSACFATERASYNLEQADVSFGLFVLGGFALPIFFYDVDKEYIGYLKQFEQKIPNISYDKHDKFVCGIVLTVNGFNYFAPVSSFNKSQKTNFLINDKIGNAVASIRFSFMFPVPNELLKIKEFHKEEEKYRNLLQYEYKYCNKHIDEIYKKAQYVYKRVKIKDSFYSKICCNFELLEIKCLDYYNNFIALQEIAAAKKEEKNN